MAKDERIELVINTVDEFKNAHLTGWSGAALHGRIEMLKEYGKYLFERVTGLPSHEFSGLHLQNVTNPVKIMDWKYTETEKPHAYLIGNWDGRNSDNVVAEGKSGKQYLAHYCEGFMDGSEFSDWYENSDFLINEEIVRWLSIPS